MIVFTFNKNDMDSGTQPILRDMDWSRLSLKSNVYQRPVTFLKDGRKVSLNPKKFTRE
jgi:hypothetical protein